MTARLTSRLAARGAARQVEASLRADRIAEAADAAARRVWAGVLRLLRSGEPWPRAHRAALELFRGLLPAIIDQTAAALARQARWGWRAARANLKATLPRRYALAALAMGGGHEREAAHRRQDRPEVLLPRLPRPPVGGRQAARPLALPAMPRPLREDAGDAPRLDWADLLAGSADPFDLVFPPPSEADVAAVVYAGDWRARLASGTRLATPEALASALAGGVAAGKPHRDIARDLLPLVGGVRSTARRVARTEAMRVSNAAQMACHRQLGDLVVGWQVHATLDGHTRPWHALRSGTVYYARPRPGQLGYDRMPHPPQEADGSVAWNCRCYLTPVLSELEGDSHGAVSADLEPDPAVFSDWFRDADERRRRVAVGARRYAAALAVTPDRDVEWSLFVDPDTGRLLGAAELKAESAADRALRVARVRALIDRRRDDLRRAARLGYV